MKLQTDYSGTQQIPMFFNDKKITRKISPNLINKLHHHKSPSAQKSYYVRDIMKPTLKLADMEQELFGNILNKIVNTQQQKVKTTSERKFEMVTSNQPYISYQQQNHMVNILIAENESLKKKNNQLNNIINGRQTKRVFHISQCIDVTIYNHPLYYQQSILTKDEIQSIKHNISADNIVESKQNNNELLQTYLSQAQSNNKILKDQNKKLKFQIDYLRRKIYNDVDTFKKMHNKQLFEVTDKYMKLLDSYQNLSKNHCDLSLKMKRITFEPDKPKLLDPKLQHSLSLSSCSESLIQYSINQTNQ